MRHDVVVICEECGHARSRRRAVSVLRLCHGCRRRTSHVILHYPRNGNVLLLEER